ncbi:MAG: 50S ribosomal protein L25 [Planctomycetia bacterium]|nr:50S ribosomal protein L25 [Planctomycetia bacterium]
MAESVTLTTEPREAGGSRVARRLRRQDPPRIPAVVYGHKEAVLNLSLLEEELVKALRHGARVIELKVGGKDEQTLIQEVQYDHLGLEILHVDFRRVSKDEKVVVTVRLELKGLAPGVTAGGVLDQPIHALHVECLALSLPDSIRVNINELQIGSVIHVKDLTLPPGVKAMDDADAVVVQVKAPEAEPTPGAEVPGAAGAVEPEVITRRAAEDKEGEGEK